MKTLYDSEGKTKTMDFVDAREHLAMGGWFEEPPVKESPTADIAPPADAKGAVPGDSDSVPCPNADLTKAELLEKLGAITDMAKPAMSKAELLDMLNELEAQ